ncbi:MAG TPA: hypothetical protein VK835_08260 [Bacteroidia bacterium]|jgi:hypothetical protein|nr:hypothetical protein [Bacteroidia bacterium]
MGGNSDWTQNNQSKDPHNFQYNTVGLGFGAEFKSPLKNIAPSLGFPSFGSTVISLPKARTIEDSAKTAEAFPADSMSKAFYKRNPKFKK